MSDNQITSTKLDGEDDIFTVEPEKEAENRELVVLSSSPDGSTTHEATYIWKNPAEKVLPPWEFSFPLTKEKLFKLSLSVNDPMRPFLGFFYEKQLRTECEALIRLPLFTVEEIYCAWSCRRANPWFFRCCAIDYILMAYLTQHQQSEEW